MSNIVARPQGQFNVALLDDFIEEASVSAIPTIETTILSFLAPVNLFLMSMIVGGMDNADFRLKIDGIEVLKIHNNWTERTKEFDLALQKIALGQTVAITVLNKGMASNTFEAKLNAKVR